MHLRLETPAASEAAGTFQTKPRSLTQSHEEAKEAVHDGVHDGLHVRVLDVCSVDGCRSERGRRPSGPPSWMTTRSAGKTSPRVTDAVVCGFYDGGLQGGASQRDSP